MKVLEKFTKTEERFKRRVEEDTLRSLKSDNVSGPSESCTSTTTEIPVGNSGNDSSAFGTTSNDDLFKSPYLEKITNVSESNQNRQSWPNLARAADRCGLSDRSVAIIVNAALEDLGYITKTNTKMILDRSKVRRERQKHRKRIQKEEDMLWNAVTGIYVDGKRDATLTTKQRPNGKHCKETILEDHHVVVGEPGGFYLTHYI